MYDYKRIDDLNTDRKEKKKHAASVASCKERDSYQI